MTGQRHNTQELKPVERVKADKPHGSESVLTCQLSSLVRYRSERKKESRSSDQPSQWAQATKVREREKESDRKSDRKRKNWRESMAVYPGCGGGKGGWDVMWGRYLSLSLGSHFESLWYSQIKDQDSGFKAGNFWGLNTVSVCLTELVGVLGGYCPVVYNEIVRFFLCHS